MDVIAPGSVDEVVAALATPGARLVAGGTDILPNLKHRLDRPPLLVSLCKLPGFDKVIVDEAAGVLRIGAGARLADLAVHPETTSRFPSLARAAGLVASPLIRNMGTLGGNINLDTRCRYVNQTHFWRSAISGCLKSEGDVCHVVRGGRSCVAAMSSDCAPVLISLDARVVQVGPDGEREVPLESYYNSDGVAHINRAPCELTTEVRVPLPAVPQRAVYAKWTVRRSIDFPLISVALRFDLATDRVDANITGARICLGVLASRPKLLSSAGSLAGRRLADRSTIDLVCDLVQRQGKPLDNVPYEAEYRRKMIPVYTRRALEELVATEPAPARS
jgi:4-hydroxybenzoyl-CoA reductase subunit beta